MILLRNCLIWELETFAHMLPIAQEGALLFLYQMVVSKSCENFVLKVVSMFKLGNLVVKLYTIVTLVLLIKTVYETLRPKKVL